MAKDIFELTSGQPSNIEKNDPFAGIKDGHRFLLGTPNEEFSMKQLNRDLIGCTKIFVNEKKMYSEHQYRKQIDDLILESMSPEQKKQVTDAKELVELNKKIIADFELSLQRRSLDDLNEINIAEETIKGAKKRLSAAIKIIKGAEAEVEKNIHNNIEQLKKELSIFRQNAIETFPKIETENKHLTNNQ